MKILIFEGQFLTPGEGGGGTEGGGSGGGGTEGGGSGGEVERGDGDDGWGGVMGEGVMGDGRG